MQRSLLMPTFDHAPETKAGIAGDDAQQVFDALMRAFEDYKTENDTRLKAIEAGKGDVLLEEKVDRINDALDAQQRRLDAIVLRQARPALELRGRIVEIKGRKVVVETDVIARGEVTARGRVVAVEMPVGFGGTKPA